MLDGSQNLAEADGPRDLEQRTSELIGAELHQATHEVGKGLWFNAWLADLVTATQERIEGSDDGSWEEGPFLLLHGLAATVPRSLLPRTELNRARRRARRAAAGRTPDWLGGVWKVAATGRVEILCDAYGTRFAVVAEYAYPGDDRSTFLFDIDASGFVTLVDAAVFDDAAEAADTWRAAVGPAAEHARAEPVSDAAQLLCLAHLDHGEQFVLGNEPRRVMDSWFRAARRIGELADALQRRGTPLPQATSLYHHLDITVLSEPFVEWYRTRHEAEPDPGAVEALAEEWMSGALPQTWFSVSPRRVEFLGGLIGDWIPDEVTATVRRLLPEWVRWLGERAALPEHLHAPLEVAIAQAAVEMRRSGGDNGQDSL